MSKGSRHNKNSGRFSYITVENTLIIFEDVIRTFFSFGIYLLGLFVSNTYQIYIRIKYKNHYLSIKNVHLTFTLPPAYKIANINNLQQPICPLNLSNNHQSFCMIFSEPLSPVSDLTDRYFFQFSQFNLQFSV